MKNTPFKMNGFSGFGNSPLKDTNPHTSGHTHESPETPKASMMGSHVYHEKGYTDKKKKKKRGSGWWRKTGRKTLKIIDKILPGGKESIWKGNIKIGCGPRGCK